MTKTVISTGEKKCREFAAQLTSIIVVIIHLAVEV